MKRTAWVVTALVAAMIAVTGCASGNNSAAIAAFEQQLITQYEIPEDAIVTVYQPVGIPKADILLKHETCRAQLAGYEDGPDEDKNLDVYVLKVGDWSPPGYESLQLQKEDALSQLAKLCKMYSPPPWAETV